MNTTSDVGRTKGENGKNLGSDDHDEEIKAQPRGLGTCVLTRAFRQVGAYHLSWPPATVS
jgi:hypothetical protein